MRGLLVSLMPLGAAAFASVEARAGQEQDFERPYNSLTGRRASSSSTTRLAHVTDFYG